MMEKLCGSAIWASKQSVIILGLIRYKRNRSCKQYDSNQLKMLGTVRKQKQCIPIRKLNKTSRVEWVINIIVGVKLWMSNLYFTLTKMNPIRKTETSEFVSRGAASLPKVSWTLWEENHFFNPTRISSCSILVCSEFWQRKKTLFLSILDFTL